MNKAIDTIWKITPYINSNWWLTSETVFTLSHVIAKVSDLLWKEDLWKLSDDDFWKIYNFVSRNFPDNIEQDSSLWEEYLKRLNLK